MIDPNKQVGDDLMMAAINCGHTITDDEITLSRDPKRPGCSLNQLRERVLAAHLAARQPLADSFVAPVVTVDTPEFRLMLGEYFLSCEDTVALNNEARIIAHIDAHTARAVAAAVAPLREALDKAHARQLELESPPAQPVAGELPPLPAAIHNAFMTLESDEGHYSIVMKFNQKEDAFEAHQYLACPKAAQPVQQPAAVGMPTFAEYAPRAIEGVAPEPFIVGNQYRTQGGRLVRFIGVSNEGTSYETMFDELEHHRYTRRDFGRGTGASWDDDCVPPLYAAPVPAAGVQGDIGRCTLQEHCRCKDYEPDVRAICANWIETPTDQPDSERDAALALAYGVLWHVNAGVEAPAECEVVSVTPERAAYEARKVLCEMLTHEQRGQGIRAAHEKLLAAHPAPSSDAALSDKHRAVIVEAAQVLESAAAHNRSKSRTVLAHDQQSRADRLREIIAAHPANGAQAGLSDEDAVAIYDRAQEEYKEWYRLLDGYPSERVAKVEFVSRILAATKKGN